MVHRERKLVVIGASSVGTTFIYALLPTGIAGEIVLLDADQKRVEGHVMDLCHGLPYVPPVKIRSGRYQDCADANLIVVTAGARQSPGQSRTDLVRENADIIRSICDQIRPLQTDAVMIMVTNPVDTLTQVALQRLEWPRQRVIGSGTVLDTARFRYMLSNHCHLDVRNVHGYILGEHGESEVAAWSMTNLAGIPIRYYCTHCQKCPWQAEHKKIADSVRDSAYHIIDYKGSTYFGIGMSLVRIAATILRNEHSVLTVSSLLEGEYNINNICLSVPSVLGQRGIERIITAPLAAEEQTALEDSARKLRSVLNTLH